MPRRLKQLNVKPWNEGFRGFIKETQATLSGDSFWNLRKKIRSYCVQRQLDLGDWTDLTHRCVCDALERENKGVRTHCTPEVEKAHPETEAKRKADRDPRGPQHLKRGNTGSDAYSWKQLHLAAKDGLLDAKFMKAFTNRIACGVCKTHTEAFVKKNPIPPSDAFGWSVFFHNWVNRLLKKPEMSVGDAWNLWS